MQKHLTVEFDDIRIVMGRASAADARVRRQVFESLGEMTRNTNTFAFFITQVESAINYPISDKLTVFPGEDRVKELFAEWEEQTDEILLDELEKALMALRANPNVDGQKKQSAPSFVSTSVMEPIPIP